MKNNNINIEQLYQELLSQEPSLVGQKTEIIGLLERMTKHTPSVSIDPLFQSNLKEKLTQHLDYMHHLAQQPKQPTKNLNRLASLISYGFPAVALGVIVFLVVPYQPVPIPTPAALGNPSPSVSQEIKTQQNIEIDDNPQSSTSTTSTLPGVKPKQISTEKASKQLLPETTAAPMMMRSTTNQTNKQADTTLEYSSFATAAEDSSLQATSNIQQYTTPTMQLSYTLTTIGSDLQLEGTLGYCDQNYSMLESLIGVQKDSKIIANIKTTNPDHTQRIILQFTDGLITNVQGLSPCK